METRLIGGDHGDGEDMHIVSHICRVAKHRQYRRGRSIERHRLPEMPTSSSRSQPLQGRSTHAILYQLYQLRHLAGTPIVALYCLHK